MKRRCYITGVLLILVFIALVLPGCRLSITPPKQPSTTKAQSTVKSREEKLSEKLLNEKEVKSGRVYIKDGTVICTIVFKDGTTPEDAKSIGQKYANVLRNEYKSMKISVQGVQKNKNVVNIQYGS